MLATQGRGLGCQVGGNVWKLGGGIGDNSGGHGFGPNKDKHGGRKLGTIGGCGNWESGNVHDSENNESTPVNGRRHQRHRGGRAGARHRRIYV